MAYDTKNNVALDVNVTANPGRNLEAETRDFLLQRLDYAKDSWGYWSEGYRKLQKSFGINNVEFPKSPAEFLERIQSKKYTLWTQEKFEKIQENREIDDSVCPPDFHEFFSWQDPAVKEDSEGFEKQLKLIADDVAKVRTSIMVDSASDARKALEEFLAKDYTSN